MTRGDIILQPFGISQLLLVLNMYSVLMLLHSTLDNKIPQFYLTQNFTHHRR